MRHTFNDVNDQGVWAYRNGSLQKVAVTGDAAPGATYRFLYEFGAPVINAQGRTSFSANLTGPNPLGQANYSVWSEGRTGALEMVAQQGQQAPGLPAGYTFYGNFKDPSINVTGRIAFFAQVANLSNVYGIWAQDVNYNLQLVALADSPIAGSGLAGTIVPGEFAFLSGSGNQDGRRSAYNDIGQVAFRARLSSNVQAGIVSNIAVIPEPPANFLMGLVCLTTMIKRNSIAR